MTTRYTLITGASSGIGAAAARLFSQERDIILNGRDWERLSEVAAACSVHGRNAIIFPYDLSETEGLAAALEEFLHKNAVLVDSFVHCAGMTEVLPITKTKYHVGLKVMNVNYFSATEIISTLLKRKINAGTLKKIVFVTSIAASQGAPHQPHYCASKGALEALRITLARDLAPKVQVNAVAPGSFRTRMWNTPLADIPAEENWHPPTLLPPGCVEDVAQAIHFLLSDAANYLTGVLLPVNGGELLYR